MRRAGPVVLLYWDEPASAAQPRAICGTLGFHSRRRQHRNNPAENLGVSYASGDRHVLADART
jgi:hypothetical protein